MIPLAIAADTDFVLTATNGVIGIENFTIEVVAVPEPTSAALLAGLGMLGFVRR